MNDQAVLESLNDIFSGGAGTGKLYGESIAEDSGLELSQSPINPNTNICEHAEEIEEPEQKATPQISKTGRLEEMQNGIDALKELAKRHQPEDPTRGELDKLSTLDVTRHFDGLEDEMQRSTELASISVAMGVNMTLYKDTDEQLKSTKHDDRPAVTEKQNSINIDSSEVMLNKKGSGNTLLTTDTTVETLVPSWITQVSP